MEIRTSLSSLIDQALAGTSQTTAQLAHLQAEASTGNALQAPSDGPAATAGLLAAQAQASQYGAYLSNIQSATAVLNDSASALHTVSNVLSQAQTIALQGSQSTNDSASYGALADQVDQLLSQLLTAANSKSGNQYLFGGAASQSAPFAVTATNTQGLPQTISYNGSSDPGSTIIGPQGSVQTLYDGSQVFGGSGANNAFQVLISLRDDLRNTAGLNSNQQIAAIQATLPQIQQVSNSVLDAQGKQSADLQSLQSLQTNFQDIQLSAQQLATNLGGADIATVTVKLQGQQNQLEFTLASLTRIMSVSLLDFLH